MAWWYMSFVDPDLSPPPDEQVPGGRSWLGACYVRASNEVLAVTASHLHGCNPGGEVAMVGPLSEEHMDEHVPAGDRHRLLTLAELNR